MTMMSRFSGMGPVGTVGIGVIGCGYWGPNHIRSFHSLHGEGARMLMAADPDQSRRRDVENMFPGVNVVASSQEVFAAPDVDAVVLATPARMHFEQARQALEAGKHVLVEKPLTTNLAEAEELARLAADRELVLMVGHTFQYAGAIEYIRNAISSGELGRLSHIRSLRLNLGLFRNDIDVLWDLAPHDLSILLHVLERLPKTIQATAGARVSSSIYDIVNLTLAFGDGLEAHITVSWLDPQETRRMTIAGDRKMLVYDDMSDGGAVQVYDSGLESIGGPDGGAPIGISYRRGDILTPMFDQTEPLLAECKHFIECCRFGHTDSGAGVGMAVTAIIEAAHRSIQLGAKPVTLDVFDGAGSISEWLDSASKRARHGHGKRSLLPRRRVDGGWSADASGSTVRLKAIVVDADESSRLLAADVLTAFEPGFDVVTVSDVDGAHEWVQSFVPDLVVVSERIDQQAAIELIDLVGRSSDEHRCRVVSVGHNPTIGGAMAPRHHVDLNQGAGLAQWLDAIRHVFDFD